MRLRSIVKESISWALYIFVGIVFSLFVNKAIIVNAEVVSGSMEKTIMTDNKIIGSRLAYLFESPERYDVVIFIYPDDETSDPFVKRIIGLPGEKVEIIDGKIYVNDSVESLNDSFINDNEQPFGNYGPFNVPENCYFVLGDNRNHSNDSKDWKNSFVSKDKLLGKVLIEYSFFDHVRIVK